MSQYAHTAWKAGQQVSPGVISSIAQTPDGYLWLGTEFGLRRFDGVRSVPWQGPAGEHLAEVPIRSLQAARDGRLWIGTPTGLASWKDGKLTHYPELDGYTVEALLEDREGTIWAGGWASEIGRLCMIQNSGTQCWERMAVSVPGSRRCMRIARATSGPAGRLACGDAPERTIQTTVFDSSDGVKSHRVHSGYDAIVDAIVTKAVDGRLWFVPFGGVSVIDPHHLPFNKLPPPVHIEQITADGKTSEASQGLRLPPLVRDLTIDYTALSLVVPEKAHFRFKLEGQDKDWREVVNDRRVEYSNLGPKPYRFLVKACNNSGVWNEEGAALDFVIPPAWYQTNWFLAMCVAAFLALLWALYQYRLHQLARQFNMRLEERVGERTRIARDLHDTLLQSFHGILLYLQSGINLLPERPAEAKKTFEIAAEQAERAIIEGREAVQGLRASTVERNDFALAIKTLGGELAAAGQQLAPAGIQRSGRRHPA